MPPLEPDWKSMCGIDNWLRPLAVINVPNTIYYIIIHSRNYIISCLDDCSRKVASRWSERKRSSDVLNVLEDWIMINGKPERVMHDNGKQFTSKMFRHFLVHNQIKDR